MMHQLIPKIGKGQRGAKDLTWDEAKQAMTALIENQLTPTQAGAFLMAMRIKMEGVAELAAFTTVARQYVAPLPVPKHLHVVDLPTYGEKHETFHACVAAAIVAAAGGVHILMHGGEHPTAPSDAGRVLAALGIPIDQSSQQVAERLENHGLAYLDLALYHPPLGRFLDLRREMGVQNMFHQVARMLNPARADSQVIGIGHPPYLEKIVEAGMMMGNQELLIFQGIEGLPELSMTTGTVMRELRHNRIFPLTLRPHDCGLRFGSFHDMALPHSDTPASVPNREARLIKAMLENRITGGQRDWVVYNAALLLYAGGITRSVADAAPQVQQILNSGAAAKKLDELGKSEESPITQQMEVHEVLR